MVNDLIVKSLNIAWVGVCVVLACAAGAQTYQVGPDGSTQAPDQKKPSQPASLGWGSNIQNARLARAAELALQHGDHALALDYAQRAAEAAPNDPQLWFLLGYAARLNGKSQQSIDAYSHGLRLSPNSLDGISGLAQTYSVTGNNEEAERLLKQVLAADPRRSNDALILGDIYMKAADYTSALDALNRVERIHPDARPELLMGICYERLKRMDIANHYFDLARRHAPDNPEVQRSMASYFREVGKNGDAINALKSIRNPKPEVANPNEALFRATDGNYDLVIVSLGLANFDALRLCSQIRSLDRTRNVPILAITEPDNNARMVRGLEIGVNDYLMRPIDKNELLARARSQVRKRRYTERLRDNVQISIEMAITDALTGLFNRRYMENHLATLIEQAGARGKPLAALVLDIDYFKSINDTHGHDAGDDVLRDFALRIKRSIRGIDLACRTVAKNSSSSCRKPTWRWPPWSPSGCGGGSRPSRLPSPGPTQHSGHAFDRHCRAARPGRQRREPAQARRPSALSRQARRAQSGGAGCRVSGAHGIPERRRDAVAVEILAMASSQSRGIVGDCCRYYARRRAVGCPLPNFQCWVSVRTWASGGIGIVPLFPIPARLRQESAGQPS